jgi:hypothetical protein
MGTSAGTDGSVGALPRAPGILLRRDGPRGDHICADPARHRGGPDLNEPVPYDHADDIRRAKATVVPGHGTNEVDTATRWWRHRKALRRRSQQDFR